MAKVSKAMAKSTEVMQIMNGLMNVPQMNKTMKAMAMEMEKAGLIEEMINDTLDPIDQDVEEAADEELQSIIDEIVVGKINQTNVPSTKAEEDPVMADLQKRKEKLKN